jgi:hypothetical protein
VSAESEPTIQNDEPRPDVSELGACKRGRDDHRGRSGPYIVRREYWPRLTTRPNRWVVRRGQERVGGDGLTQLCDHHAKELKAEPFSKTG